jgi:nucleoside-triphosphatase THEP1
MAEILYILTGPVQSGKTTTITNWTMEKNDVFGILTPVINGKRMFMDVHSREKFEMEANSGEAEILMIGKFKFSKAGFSKAEDILRNGLNKKKGWLVVDEIGPLELRGEGFSEILKKILQSSSSQQKILLVVRDSILEEVIQFFGIRQYHCVVIDTKSDLFKK